jgi:hypothetical protein
MTRLARIRRNKAFAAGHGSPLPFVPLYRERQRWQRYMTALPFVAATVWQRWQRLFFATPCEAVYHLNEASLLQAIPCLMKGRSFAAFAFAVRKVMTVAGLAPVLQS